MSLENVRPAARRRFWLHDGAPLLFGRVITDFWNENYGERCTWICGRLAWLNLSRDLNPRELRLYVHMGRGCIKRINQKKVSVTRGYRCGRYLHWI